MLPFKINVEKNKVNFPNLQNCQVCEVCWSNVLQGVDAHIERFPPSIYGKIDEADCKPVG